MADVVTTTGVHHSTLYTRSTHVEYRSCVWGRPRNYVLLCCHILPALASRIGNPRRLGVPTTWQRRDSIYSSVGHMQHSHTGMNQLPLARGSDGRLQLRGSGPVTLAIDYTDVLGTGGQAVVFEGEILSDRGDRGGAFCGQADLLMKVCGQHVNMCVLKNVLLHVTYD